MKLGEKLYNLRKDKNLTEEALAYELEVSKSALRKWEQNDSKPSIENLLRICEFFETNIYELLEDVSNINFSGANFEGSNYVISPNNSTINYSNSPDLIELVQSNQEKINDLLDNQTRLLQKLFSK
jgi:transcriptional regulator with XRE-family HTH domain